MGGEAKEAEASPRAAWAASRAAISRSIPLRSSSPETFAAVGMAGFDRDKARKELNIPEDYEVEAMIAVGKPGDVDSLPKDLKEREVPTGRKPITQISCEGKFSFG